MSKEVSKQITLKPPVNKMLDKLVESRIENVNPIHARQNIVAELIGKAYRREVK